MSAVVEESLFEQVRAVASEFDEEQEQALTAAEATTNDFKQERHAGKAVAFSLAADRLRVVLENAGGER